MKVSYPWRWPLYWQTIVALVLGVVAGLWLGPRAAGLGEIAKFLIQVIKILAIPLLFLAIYDALIRNEFRGKGIFYLVILCVLNGLGAVTIGLLISNIFQPGKWMPLQAGAEAPPLPNTNKAFELMATSPMILAIVGGVFFGALTLLARNLSEKKARWPKRLQEGSEKALGWIMKIVGWVVHLVPIAIFASVAKVLGEHGFKLLGGLSAYFFACLGGMILHVTLVYHGWILGFAHIALRRFWHFAREPVVYAFGVNSSLATLPLTLKALNGLKVSPGSARLSACVGTNLNNDGILLYEVVAVLFLSQAYGHELSLGHQLMTALFCVVATVGVGGIPEAGIISLSLVLGAVHLPVEGIPLLLSVDWVLARCRSSVNVLGDMTVAVAIDRWQGNKFAHR